jgi:hypothetical protein
MKNIKRYDLSENEIMQAIFEYVAKNNIEVDYDNDREGTVRLMRNFGGFVAHVDIEETE